ncbi:MAG: carbohydrate ABC transporter permease [Candidatus Humimicrobiaceae bacterium]
MFFSDFKSKLESNKSFPYLLVLPAIIFIVLYIFYPIIFSFILSLFNWDGLRPLGQAEFLGFKNYLDLAKDPIFWNALKNTVYFVLGTLIFQNFFGFTLALTLFYGKIKGGKAWRAIIFFPAILSPVIIGIVFTLIFSNTGLVNQVLASLRLGNLQKIWLGNMITPIWVITFVNIWQWSGYNMVLYYAGLQSIPDDLIEAARIDGAGWRQIILKIIIPCISGTASIVFILNIIGGFKVFDLVYIMTSGGPAHASEVLTSYMFYSSFALHGLNKMGYGSAIAVILTIIIFVIAIIRVRMSRNLEY